MTVTHENQFLFDKRNAKLVSIMDNKQHLISLVHIRGDRMDNLPKMIENRRKKLLNIFAKELEDNIGDVRLSINFFVLTTDELYEMLEMAFSVGSKCGES